jgi:hypothetical protein
MSGGLGLPGLGCSVGLGSDGRRGCGGQDGQSHVRLLLPGSFGLRDAEEMGPDTVLSGLLTTRWSQFI